MFKELLNRSQNATALVPRPLLTTMAAPDLLSALLANIFCNEGDDQIATEDIAGSLAYYHADLSSQTPQGNDLEH